MDDLITRIESASEGSRELDWEIHRARAELAHGDSLWGIGIFGGHPHYTTSIDAALILLPEGWRWFVNSQCLAALGTGRGNSKVVVASPDWNAESQARAATPALALCAAILRATAATPYQEDGK